MSNTAARINMIKQQLRTGSVVDERILSIYDEIHRDKFVPSTLTSFAYSDMQIPLNHGQCMMTPLEEASLLQSLALQGHEVVLEVGTGSGFLTALLSRLCKQVISIDYYSDFTVNARHHLADYHCSNVELITGDASLGWVDKAPYDVIVFTSPLEELSDMQRLQLLPGGRLFAIIGKKPIMQAQLHTRALDGTWNKEVIFETCLPPLINQLTSKPTTFDCLSQNT